MSVEITGVEEVLAKLEQRFSQSKMTQVEKRALSIAGRVIAVRLRSAVSSYRDTGATVREVKVSMPRRKDGKIQLKIGWAGDGTKQRWRLVHLNEFGYTRNGRIYSPRGLGVIKKSYDSSKHVAKQMEIHELRKALIK